MKYGNHQWVKTRFSFGNWKCTRCNIIVNKPYEKPPVWRVGNSPRFTDSRDMKIPKTCEEVLMHEALE